MRLPVDFNEMVEGDLVLLSNTDIKKDLEGNPVQLKEGMQVTIFEPELDSSSEGRYLLAKGKVVSNPYQDKYEWTSTVKWCCRIDPKGIYSASKG